MTRERARAHARVMMTLTGPAPLLPSEQARAHCAADALLFCADIAADRSARAAFADIETMREQLVATRRWTRAGARRLVDDVWACGPGALRAAA